jgi:hypothetical protein
VFSPDERELLRQTLLSNARADDRISGAALTGSAAQGCEDSFSDIDLAFGVVSGIDLSLVIADWTTQMYQDHNAVHHTDMTSGPVLYRVFFLGNTLQVDLAFSSEDHFGAIAPSFRLIFGRDRELPEVAWPASNELIGMGWLHALHARSSIARKRVWQAEYMVSGFRYQALALACLREGVSPNQGRGIDSLSSEITDRFAAGIVRSLNVTELKRAFGAVGVELLGEIERVDLELAHRLTEPLQELTRA